VLVALVFAAISVYYYFKVIQAMYFKSGEPEIMEVSNGYKTAIILVSLLVIAIGVLPSIVLNWFYF
jgi:NADH-quinone oxidoreductase subunit N